MSEKGIPLERKLRWKIGEGKSRVMVGKGKFGNKRESDGAKLLRTKGEHANWIPRSPKKDKPN